MWRAPSILVAIVLVLLAIGIVMLASTSSVKGGDRYEDPHYFLKRQLVWLALALVAGLTSAFLVDYHWWRRLSLLIAAAAIVLLALVFVPGVGVMVGGARRWLRIGPLGVGQPSELAKFAVIVMLAAWMTHMGRRADRVKEGLLIPLCGLGAFLGLIMLEPDYGTTFLIGMTGMAVMFAGGSRLLHLFIAGLIGVSGFALAIMQSGVRTRRLLAFLNPEAHPDAAYQLRESMNAFVLGGTWGAGLDLSLQKHNYLPEAHTDFILAIIGEELGVVATVAVVLLFVGFLFCGLIISLNATDMFGKLLGFGITVVITLQAAINVAVVTGCMPTKGLPLPFISAGGSSLVMTMFSVGALVNIARHASGEAKDRHTQAIKDSVHWT